MDKLEKFLSQHKRVAILGGPVTGKSIVTDHAGPREVVHSDDFQFTKNGVDWSEQSEILRDYCAGKDDFVVAGIVADRAVRKGLEVDAIIHCDEFMDHLPSNGQKVLKKQIDSRVKKLAKTITTVKLKDLL